MENNEQLCIESQDLRAEEHGRFAVHLKSIRRVLQNKQVWLSGAVGCSESAVSHWESGARVPSPSSIGRLIAALAAEGTPTSMLVELRRAWLTEYLGRRIGRPSTR